MRRRLHQANSGPAVQTFECRSEIDRCTDDCTARRAHASLNTPIRRNTWILAPRSRNLAVRRCRQTGRTRMVVSTGAHLPGGEKSRHQMVPRAVGQHGDRGASLGPGEPAACVWGKFPGIDPEQGECAVAKLRVDSAGQVDRRILLLRFHCALHRSHASASMQRVELTRVAMPTDSSVPCARLSSGSSEGWAPVKP